MSIHKLKPIAKELKENKSTCNQNDKFIEHIVYECAFASNNFKSEQFDFKKAKQEIKDGLNALEAKGGLQSMLAAQMLSIHQLQQRSMSFANASGSMHIKLQQYYTNSAIKLANCFVQQTNMLAKLQGVGGQKIIVERVDVHQGGQAIVGNINSSQGRD